MQGWGSALQTGASYVGKMGGYARNMHSAGMSRFGAVGMASIYGAAGGGLYGATLGRDYGQSRLGGFTTGAMMGAGIGAAGARYGVPMYRSGVAQARFGLPDRATSGLERLGLGIGAAGKAGYSAVRDDARRAAQYIGNSKIMTNNGFNQIKSSMKAGYASV